MRASVAVISFSPIASDSRVLRQLRSVGSSYSVLSVGYGPSPPGVAFHLELPSSHSLFDKFLGILLLLLRRYSLFHGFWFHRRSIVSFLAQHRVQVVILNDVSSWPLARFFPVGKVILDAHEYSPQELSDQFLWTLFLRPFKMWCSRFATLGAHRFCVEPHLCALWQSFSGCSFALLPNSSAYVPAPLSAPRASSTLRVLHHGVGHPSRRIELMIEAINLAGPRFSGTFLLTGADRVYLHRLGLLSSASRCEILPPIPQEDLIAHGASYDLAILSIYPSNLNYAHCLPNKLYQFIQSRLPIVCGPTPAIAQIVRDYEIGVVADDFSSAALASALQSLTPTLLGQMRSNLERAALELCWERDCRPLLDAVQSVMNSEV